MITPFGYRGVPRGALINNLNAPVCLACPASGSVVSHSPSLSRSASVSPSGSSTLSATSSKSVSSRWVGGPRQVWGGGRGGVHAFPQAISPLALAQLQQCTWLMSEPRWVGWGGTIVAVVAPLCTEVRCTAMPFAIKEPC